MSKNKMIIKNDHNIYIPEYLDIQFFQSALEEGLREMNITIHEINFEWGSNLGENYCSSIYRVLVTFARVKACKTEHENISLIVKSIPVSPENRFLEDAEVFVKEKLTYFDVLPRLEILLDDEQFGAKCYYTRKDPINTIVFSDLKVHGFRVASRQDMLDWEHSKLVLQQLAKFHATSMVLAKRDPSIVKRFHSGMLSPNTILDSDIFSEMFGSSLVHLIEKTSKWSGYEKITKKLQILYDNFKEITSKVALPQQDDKFIVLNHGDMWTNNFMFAYDDSANKEVPTRALFVDFQLCFYGSPGCDINFFLNTSVQLNVLQNKRDELIAVYFKALSSTLEHLRYDQIPTLDDLYVELRQRELYGLFALYGFLPMVTMPKELSEDNSIEKMANPDLKRQKFEKVFANEKLLNFFRYGLKRIEQLGVMDEII